MRRNVCLAWFMGAAFLAAPLAAQDVEPRALSPAPVGTNVIGVAASLLMARDCACNRQR